MNSPEIKVLQSLRGQWELSDAYCNPGPLQFGDDTPLQKYIHRGTDYLFGLNKVNSSLKMLARALRPGVDAERLRVASSMIESMVDFVGGEKRVSSKKRSSIMSPTI